MICKGQIRASILPIYLPDCSLLELQLATRGAVIGLHAPLPMTLVAVDDSPRILLDSSCLGVLGIQGVTRNLQNAAPLAGDGTSTSIGAPVPRPAERMSCQFDVVAPRASDRSML